MKKALIIIGTVLGVILLALTAFVVWATWEHSDGDMQAEVDAIKVPSAWSLMSEENMGKVNFCPMGDCPSARREWKLDRVYSAEELQKIFAPNVRFVIDGECITPEQSTSSLGTILCTGDGKSDNYRYFIREANNDDNTEYYLRMTVNRL